VNLLNESLHRRFLHSFPKNETNKRSNDNQKWNEAVPGPQAKNSITQILGEIAFFEPIQTKAIDVRIGEKALRAYSRYPGIRGLNRTSCSDKHLSKRNQA
jgi:hypothetical protein